MPVVINFIEVNEQITREERDFRIQFPSRPDCLYGEGGPTTGEVLAHKVFKCSAVLTGFAQDNIQRGRCMCEGSAMA